MLFRSMDQLAAHKGKVVRECLRGRLVFDDNWRLCLQELDVVGGSKQLLMAQLAAHKGKVVRLSIEETAPVLLELEKVTF